MDLHLLRAALRSAGTGVWEWDIEADRLVEADLGFEQLGYGAGEMEHSQAAWEQLMHPEDRLSNEQAYQRHLRGEVPMYQHRYRVRAKDGSWRWFEERGQVVEWLPDGRPKRMLGTQADLTAQVALAQDAEQAREARAEAEAANRAKTDFLSRISHELRTPLNAVLGFAQLLLVDPREPPTEGQRARLGLIMDSGRHLLQMIGDLLDLTRAESGALGLRPEAVDLPAMVRECLAMLQPGAQAAGIALALEPAAPPPAWADATRLRQVLLNLIGNAIKYNRAGGSVTVRLAAAEAGLRIEVQDTGIGIADDELPRLFEPFYRGQHLKADGAGIGLAVTRSLVQAMGGTVEVRSRRGEGSVFAVVLPAAAVGGVAS